MTSPGLHSNFKASQFLSSHQASWASNRSKATRNLHLSALRGLSVRQGGSETVQSWDQPDTQVTKKVEAGIPGWQGTLWEWAKFLDFSCFFKQTVSIKNAIFKKSAFSGVKMLHYRLLWRQAACLMGHQSLNSPMLLEVLYMQRWRTQSSAPLRTRNSRAAGAGCNLPASRVWIRLVLLLGHTL